MSASLEGGRWPQCMCFLRGQGGGMCCMKEGITLLKTPALTLPF